MESLKDVRQLLRHRGHSAIAQLLERAALDFADSGQYGSHWHSVLMTAEIYAHVADHKHLQDLSSRDTQIILDALLELWPPREGDIEINSVIFRIDPASLVDPIDPRTVLLAEVEWLCATLVAVATGGPRIDTVNPEYKHRFAFFDQQLQGLGLHNPVPFDDLWRWYSKWSSGDLPTYASRRRFIQALFEPIRARLRRTTSPSLPSNAMEPTGWALVDRQIGRVRRQLETAATEEEFQAVGLYAREAMTSLARQVFDPLRHPAADKVEVSKTDAKRMLQRYLSAELSGASSEITRRHAKAALDLANQLQHRRTAMFRDAALCAEATASVVNLVAILEGVRDPDRRELGAELPFE